MTNSIHQTARSYFLVKLINGQVPDTVRGGPADGLRYFEEEFDGDLYWITETGLLGPLAAKNPGDGEATPHQSM